MEKIRRTPMEKLRNLLIALLTLTMLLLAILYISGSQFAADTTALRAENLPDGSVSVGETAPQYVGLYEKGLLPVSFAGIRFHGIGGGAYGSDPAADTLLEFATEPIHHCLSVSSVLTEISDAEFAALQQGDFLFLDFLAALPYQMLYALTGEYTAAARSSIAINADRLLLSFSGEGTASLCISNGKQHYSAGQTYDYKANEVAALANNSRLADFTLAGNGVAKCAASPRAASLTLTASGAITEQQHIALLSLLGFRPTAAINARAQTLVDPHGTLRLAGNRFIFSTSSDGGIPVSDMLDTAKDDLDIDIYDILAGSVSLLDQLRETLPSVAGSALSPYLAGFAHENDTFTVTFGLHADSAPVGGGAFPYFIKITVQSSRFRSIEMRYIAATRSGYISTLFPSEWHYVHAEKTAAPDTLRLHYRFSTLPSENLDAAWYYTGSEVAE